jgi:uncharacterized delta-60 repeat protein
MLSYTCLPLSTSRILTVVLAFVAIIALTSPRAFAGARDGQLDPTFGNGGKVITDIAPVDLASDVAIQRDGKIVVVGTTTVDPANQQDIVVARYNVEGTLDASFGIGGIVTTDFVRSLDSARGVAIQPDARSSSSPRS